MPLIATYPFTRKHTHTQQNTHYQTILWAASVLFGLKIAMGLIDHDTTNYQMYSVASIHLVTYCTIWNLRQISQSEYIPIIAVGPCKVLVTLL